MKEHQEIHEKSPEIPMPMELTGACRLPAGLLVLRPWLQFTHIDAKPAEEREGDL